MKKILTIRAFVIGAVLSLCIGIGEVFVVTYINGSPMASNYTAGASIFLFFILTLLINPFIRIFNKSLTLSNQELCLIFVMMLVACAIPSWGFTMNLVYLLAGLHYYATLYNNWATVITPRIPKWLIPQNSEAIRLFFEGLPKGESIPWLVWIKPLLIWTVFILILYFLMVAISVIFRKQWVENENLQFPLMIVPAAMIKRAKGSIFPSLYKNKLMWMGFAFPFILNSLIALHNIYPLIPALNLRTGIPCGPGGALGWITIMLRFEVLGIAFLLSTAISLSIWFFSLFYAFQHIFFNRIGFSIGGRDIYSSYLPCNTHY